MMGAALERMLGAFRTVKASGAEHREGQRIHAAAREAWRADIRAAKWQATAGNTAGLSIQRAFIAVLATGGARVASGAIGVGTLVAFLLYVYYLMSPIQQLVNAASQYQVGAAAVARIQEAERLPVEPSGLSASRRGGGDAPAAVTFEQVPFRYRPELPEVHHGVSFSIPPRGMTAFVGPSGAGKTTVFSLIERFYEPDADGFCSTAGNCGTGPSPNCAPPWTRAGSRRREPTPNSSPATPSTLSWLPPSSSPARTPRWPDLGTGWRQPRQAAPISERVIRARLARRSPRPLPAVCNGEGDNAASRDAGAREPGRCCSAAS